MRLSILLPAYKTDLSRIVNQLQGQAELLIEDFEIICLDDASPSTWYKKNKSLASSQVRILRNDVNLGRAANRNRLASLAKFDNLLFIDGDSIISENDFIASYKEVSYNHTLIYGGTIYSEKAELGEELHWKYGTYKEAQKAQSRQKSPHLSFKTNNFLIKKDLFNRIKFDESLVRYGYEDTLFADEVKKLGLNIHHIENPVLHEGLYQNAEFLKRVEESVVHLVELETANKLSRTTRLQRFHNRFLKAGNRNWVGKGILEKKMHYHEQALKKHKLISLQLFKLACYLEAKA